MAHAAAASGPPRLTITNDTAAFVDTCLGVRTRVSGFAVSAPVPEPETYAMMFARAGRPRRSGQAAPADRDELS